MTSALDRIYTFNDVKVSSEKIVVDLLTVEGLGDSELLVAYDILTLIGGKFESTSYLPKTNLKKPWLLRQIGYPACLTYLGLLF